ncbi:hypothetical protein Z043_111400 [Scleropages formosus]|uniref:MANF/CDNF-like protein n=1 Tax=Scleropages formosus TaxID=113540 RepID=A0A0P7X017_SCLFO|nr:hypothetical protein Z043_111400 [Scleropages formosus]
MILGVSGALKDGDCEVCVRFLGSFYESLSEGRVPFRGADIENALVQRCRHAADKEVEDLSPEGLKKLKVKDLKKILDKWGEACKGCVEKSDFVRRIDELLPKHAPGAAERRTEL